MNISLEIIIAFALGLILLYLLGWFLFKPLKIIVKFIVLGVVGCLVLMAINFFGSYVGVNLPLNPVTAITAGFLGLPGVILMLILQILI